jgi:aryl-alcohol dehydrogenase-like predicted oxidoreductase
MDREGMEYRTMGRSGLPVSTIGLGCNNFGMLLDQVDSTAVVHAALDAGITLFDTSDSYGNSHSEEYLGAALAGHRDDVVIATKFSTRLRPGPYGAGASRKYVVEACEASLRRLGTDYIDLYYQHNLDPATPVEETVDTLDDLIRAGKVRYAGCSNVKGWTLAQAQHVAAERGRQRFVACQNEWSLVNRSIEAEVVPACRAYEVGIVPYFPLASGLLTGKYAKGEPFPEGSRLATASFFAAMATDEVFETVTRLQAVADDTGHSLVELALGWLLHQEGVASVLVGATKPEQVATNAATAGVSLAPDVLAAVTEAAGG